MSMLSKLTHRELIQLAQKRCITPLSPKFHKGQNGRVCIVGGCEDYTGAPYFSANATALIGCDMTHVICERDAAPVIKSYSPNLMVHPYLRTGQLGEMSKIKSLVSRVHVLVIGPGLGRDDGMLGSVKEIIRTVLDDHKGQIPIVIDADGLYLISHDQETREMLARFPRGRVIITPNVVEFKRIKDAVGGDSGSLEAGAYVASKLQCIVVEKGGEDKIFSPEPAPGAADGRSWLVNSVEGSNKRVGGQGDTLTGIIACMLAFSRARYDFKLCGDDAEKCDPRMEWLDYAMLSCYVGSTVTRECAKLAYKAKKRAMQTMDMNDRVGEVYDKLFG
ncbi:hypothetical protein HG536_0E03810 [Torulaspora globosa]|uniref:ATP-dependent (S)-NAD(P)H-hydrate dehydratase n=1 Tax=Torulaspora globosa TaxID=48254 RepID=A0A7G3ZIY4_9SACH|nr:uncharacterized protein HG536_0E03810 [Torulaspora globosa]QLL33470.1 hypothetical protein HG536_0E03810 [Torulaspora globosa]